MQKTVKIIKAASLTVAAVVVLTYTATLPRVHAQANEGAATDSALKAISSRCVGAQSKLRTIQQQTTDAGTKRSKVYQQIDARMWVAIGKVKLGGKDTADIEKTHADFNDKVAKYNELNQAFITTLNDMSSQSCRDDPATFQASLATARSQYMEIRAINTEIRTFVGEDIKTTISSFTAQGSDDSSDTDTSEE